MSVPWLGASGPGKRSVCRRQHSWTTLSDSGTGAHQTFATGPSRDDKLRLMSLRLCFFACALLNVAQITAVFAAESDNPLITESALPYQYPAFDKLKDEHFVPAIETG